MRVSHVDSPSFRRSAQERQHHQRVRLDAGPRADFLSFREIELGLRLVSRVEIQRGEAVVAWKQQLRLADRLGKRERFLGLRECPPGLAVDLGKLEYDD